VDWLAENLPESARKPGFYPPDASAGYPMAADN
jgi:hypothetical protein